MDLQQLKVWSDEFDSVIDNGVNVHSVSPQVRDAIAIISYNLAEKMLARPAGDRREVFAALPQPWKEPIREIAKQIKPTGRSS